ncbi:MAG: serine hydroxymethyltransferase [Candidatus Saccharimonadales bacterium]
MTHGLKLNFSSTFYNSVQYHARPDGYIDIDEMYKLAKEHKPKLIIGGGSAYPRFYEWEKYKEVADSVGAYFLADMSHVAGLVAAGVYPTPVGVADVVTTTTHKTLRGPRGALILANGLPSNPLKKVERTRENIPSLIDRALIPGLQGGPHNHQTAAIAVALKEASTPEFKAYGAQVLTNAQILATALLEKGYQLVTGGTDSHLLLIDLTNKNISGKQAEAALGKAGITVNKNTIPFDPRSPFDPSGIRLGTPALTSRGMKDAEMSQVAGWIDQALTQHEDEAHLSKIHQAITEFCKQFPLPSDVGR